MAQIRIPRGALVLVGDGARAVFLRNHGEPDLLDLRLAEVMQQENPRTSVQGDDAPGRRADAPSLAGAAVASGNGRMPLGAAGHGRGGPRSAMEQTDWHQLAEDRFAKTIADALYRQAHAGAFDALVVVAPPKTMAVLRKEFHKEVQARIAGEVTKDLAGRPIGDIEKALQAL